MKSRDKKIKKLRNAQRNIAYFSRAYKLGRQLINQIPKPTQTYVTNIQEKVKKLLKINARTVALQLHNIQPNTYKMPKPLEVIVCNRERIAHHREVSELALFQEYTRQGMDDKTALELSTDLPRAILATYQDFAQEFNINYK